MTNILRLSNNTPIWPYSVAQFRADEPHLSISDNPHDAELASYATLDPPIILCRVQLTPQPSYDPRTERIEGPTAEPDAEGVYHQQWTIRPATEDETAAYDLADSPQPEWMEFGIDLAMHPGITALYNAIPGPVAGGLTVGLNEAGKGDPRLFSVLWQQLLTSGAITSELLSGITSMATEHHLPAEFVGALAPPSQTE